MKLIPEKNPEKIPEKSPFKVTKAKYSADGVSNKYVGIKNQGLTCHLNVTLQLLFSIKEIVQATKICANNGKCPAKQLNEIFDIMSNPDENKEISISTKPLTNYLKDPKWLNIKSAYQSLFDIITMLENNCLGIVPDSIYSLFEVSFAKIPGKENSISLSSQSKSVQNYLLTRVQKRGKLTCNKILIVELYRKQKETHKQRIDFSLDIDLTKICVDSHKKMNLAMIIAYSSNHYCLFKKVDDVWYMIDDQICYLVSEDTIKFLQGGYNDNENPIFQRFKRNWVADILFYIDNEYKIQ